MQKTKKRQQYTRDEFSDKQVYNQIKDQIKQIRQKNLKQVEQDSLINKLYEDKKKQMKLAKMQITKQNKPKDAGQKNKDYELDIEQDQQEGEIKKLPPEQDANLPTKGAPSINDLSEHIRLITITRNKMAELFKSRKFQDIIKGCFVRYKSIDPNLYTLALVVGIVDGQKQYDFANIKTKTQLRLQQSTSEVIKLNLQHISNQHPPGNLQISKWLQANRTKIPNEKELKQKLEQINNLIHGKVSSSQIDQNLLKQAYRVANQKGQGSYNISELIYFMKNQIHDLAVTLEQIEGNKQKQHEHNSKKKQKDRYDETLKKLIQKQSQMRTQKTQKQKEEKKKNSKGYLDYLSCDRKQDKIRDLFHNKILYLCSFEGSKKIREELQAAHKQFDIDVDI